MGINSLGSNFEGLNIRPSASRTFGETPKSDKMKNFTTVEWRNKNDGETYVAKKITLKQGGEEVTGVFVYNKTAKPNEQGQIDGTFMSFDTFMEKISNEVPAVNSSLAQAYFPNIVYRRPEIDESAVLEEIDESAALEDTTPLEEVDESFPLELGIDFAENFESALKLSDGSMILKPQIQGCINQLEKDADGNFLLKSRAVIMGAEEHTRPISEEQILSDKGLCAGTIKKLDDNKYEVTYYTSQNYNNHDKTTEVMDMYDCAMFIRNNYLSTY